MFFSSYDAFLIFRFGKTTSSASTATSTQDNRSGPRISTHGVVKSLLAMLGVGLAML